MVYPTSLYNMYIIRESRVRDVPTHRFAANPNCNNNYNNFPQSHSLAVRHKRVLVRREQKLLLLCFILFEYKIVRLYIHVYGIFFFVFLVHCDQQSVNNRLFLSKRQKSRKQGVSKNKIIIIKEKLFGSLIRKTLFALHFFESTSLV